MYLPRTPHDQMSAIGVASGDSRVELFFKPREGTAEFSDWSVNRLPAAEVSSSAVVEGDRHVLVSDLPWAMFGRDRMPERGDSVQLLVRARQQVRPWADVTAGIIVPVTLVRAASPMNTRPLALPRPAAPAIADCIVNSVLLCGDEFAQSAALDYWEMSAAAHQAVLDSLREIADGTPADSALAAACADPANPHAVRALRQACVDELTRRDAAAGHASGWDVVARRALVADQVSRLWLDTGADHDRAAAPVGAADIPAPPPPAGRDDAYVAVIIPFRDQSQDMGRLRNLLACLHALGDQCWQACLPGDHGRGRHRATLGRSAARPVRRARVRALPRTL